MTKLILIAVLFFTANVAGAEVTYLCKYNSEGNFSEGIPECPPKMLFKEQPEAEESDAEKCERVCLNEYLKNGRYDIPPYFPEATKIFNGCFESCNPNDAEKWREKIFVSVCRIQNPDACRWVVAEIIEKRGKMWLVKMEDKEPEWANSEYLVWEKY